MSYGRGRSELADDAEHEVGGRREGELRRRHGRIVWSAHAGTGCRPSPGYPPADPRIDIERVSTWLVKEVDGVEPPLHFELIAGGHSNLTFKATDAAGRRLVVRRPPLGHVLATAHDMSREHRIVSAVGPTAVPVAPTLGLCEDPEVNGAPFYVMEFVDGVVLDSRDKAEQLAMPMRTVTAEHLIDVLADLHAVDVDEVGLGDLARRDGYIERQLKRWSKQWELSKTASCRRSRRSRSGSRAACRCSRARPSSTATTASGTASSTLTRAG